MTTWVRVSLSILTTLAICHVLQAQSIDDVLRYSEVNPLGTARSLGTGNSMAALGADWTAVQSNPAGLANYRNNDVNLTVAGLIRGASETQLGANTVNSGDTDLRMALPQLSLVLTKQPIGSRWTQFNFGFGVSQTNRYEENITFRGSTPGSISDAFLAEIDGLGFFDPYSREEREFTLAQTAAAIAFRAGVVIPNDLAAEFPDFYFSDYDAARSDFTDPGPDLDKRARVEREGHSSSFDISFGANYEDRLQLGATFGLVNSRFEEINRYVEDDDAGNVPVFNQLDYRRTQTQEVTGLLGRVGAIYRFGQALRVGLAYHSPTFNSVTDNLNQNIRYSATVDGENLFNEGFTNQGDVLEFNVITPSQYRASLASVIGRTGFVSADVGYIDYTGARVRYGDSFEGSAELERDYEAQIDTVMQAAVQAKLGAELNVKPVMVRGGIEYYGSPLVGEDASYAFATGVGFRQNRFSVDAAYRLTIRPARVYRPYNIGLNASIVPEEQLPIQEVTYTPTLSTIAVTVGWKLTRRYEE